MKNKFRAWYKGDISRNTPLKFVLMEDDGELFFVCEQDSDLRYRFYIPFIDDDWIVEKNTGVIDKKSKDIFEGDVVYDDYNNVSGHVLWNERNLRYEIEFKDEEENHYFDEDLTEEYASALEIVGNIYTDSCWKNECSDKNCSVDDDAVKSSTVNESPTVNKYVIYVEGNVVYAEPVIKMLVNMHGINCVEIEYIDMDLPILRPINWFRVHCKEIIAD